MSGPYSPERQDFAEQAICEALEQMRERGFGPVEAAHCLIKGGLELLLVDCCPGCLAGELTAIEEAVQDRLEALTDGPSEMTH